MLSQTVVAKGMTTGQGSERDGRRTEQENGRRTDQSQEKKKSSSPKYSRLLTLTVFQLHTDWSESTSISLNFGIC